ncbi:probable ATP-dependent permease [[Candida] jaroonii]|uniref:Probable ATP-dependent permease n=1 Tax=[Candida] jaroonii TaxID=467808 RepID=A0ACA9Y464_9ASCO|nr:probable ATP-dependent permease [[Candida] jaroonii]
MKFSGILVIVNAISLIFAKEQVLDVKNVEQFNNTFERVSKGSLLNDIFMIKPGVGPSKPPPEDCPPCFNCNLPNFECTQFSTCNAFTGFCECRDGYGGNDCSEPLCGSLSDGNKNRPIRKKSEPTCGCKSGWDGINCNMCVDDDVCDSFMPEGLKGTCYKSGIVVNKFHQMCDVTNKKIISILNGKKPQVTFSCNKTAGACDFQFWIDQKESFYCDLNKCSFDYDLKKNSTNYQCEEVMCKCLPERMLCGEAGSIDISEFLTETIRGPGQFSCDLKDKNCQFSEPSMNDLISSVFGDPYITLNCKSGECIHKSEIPGYDLPDSNRLTWSNLLLIILVAFICFMIVGASLYNISRSALFKPSGDFQPLDGEMNALNENFTPTTLSFENIQYKIKDHQVLSGVNGLVKPQECLAIMGGSGAGKTTLLDILAGKNKDGVISGNIYVNGNILADKDFKKIVGFVDQEDHLIPTLTVYETVLNSALLRLPRTMSLRAKETRVIEVLNELRILNIKDRVIGSDFQRGISGGEKRRVSIACEMVTSPSILFLDEPTSGLDAYNARNVIDCLVKLSRDFNRTIIFTIHQPRSNIVSLFDKLLLLSEGDLIYSGDMIKCNDFFSKNGYTIPLGYNIADYLIDITVDHKKLIKVKTSGADLESGDSEDTDLHNRFLRTQTSQSDIDVTSEWAHLAVHRDEYNNYNKVDSNVEETIIQVENKLPTIFKESVIAQELIEEIKQLKENPVKYEISEQYKKATFLTQIAVLSSRTFKNLYRNPKLLLTHYVLSLVMGGFCGYIYYDVKNDISGFQNRLGLFFFLLSLFGFSALTGLHTFSSERIIFIRERANNYYNPFSYYVTKIICDILPLRVLPPIILIAIAYPLVGLTMEHNAFLKTIGILVLFNVAISIEVLIIGILIRDPGTSTMVSVLILLFSILFAGLFINSEELKGQIKWLEWISLFHYAYESLSINEVKDLILKEKKFGLSIEVPGAVILSSFGFTVSAFWDDVISLIVWLAVFLVLGYVFLHFYAIERR